MYYNHEKPPIILLILCKKLRKWHYKTLYISFFVTIICYTKIKKQKIESSSISNIFSNFIWILELFDVNPHINFKTMQKHKEKMKKTLRIKAVERHYISNCFIS